MIKIGIRTNFEGFHSWPKAPIQVAFLSRKHIHMFHVTLEIEVEHDDRELEFFMVQNWLKAKIEMEELAFGNYSCERMCNTLLIAAQTRYGEERYISVRISEDEENYAEVSINGNKSN